MHLRFRRHVWLAWLAMLGLVVVPGVSRALAAAGPSQASGLPAWMQICRHGSVVPASSLLPAPGVPAGPAVDALDACGLCGLAAQLSPTPAPPAPPPVELRPVGAAAAAPTVAAALARAWSPGRPRGPPRPAA